MLFFCGLFRIIRKDQFIREKNDKLEYESLVTCLDCGRRLHSICALYMEQIWPDGFTCDSCLRAKDAKRKENKYLAKRQYSPLSFSFLSFISLTVVDYVYV